MKKCLLFSVFVLINFICSAQLPVAAFTVDDSTTCGGSCINFTNLSTNATSCQWFFQNGFPSSSTATDSQYVCYSIAGNFSVTLIATNANGSDTLIMSNYITVVNPQNIYPHSSGDTIFVVQGLIHYQWYLDSTPLPGDTLYYHVAIQDGAHYLECIDTNGCENGLGTFGALFNPDFFPSDTEFCAGTCIDFNNITQWINSGDSAYSTYQWYFNGGTPALSQEYSPLNICYNNAGTYMAKYIVLAGIISGSDSFMVNVLPCTGVLENSSQQFSLSPNPFSSHLNFRFQTPLNSTAILKIINSIGETVVEKEIKLEDLTLNVSTLPQGIYLVSIRNEQEIWISKIVK
jgi:PKD repeat protein